MNEFNNDINNNENDVIEEIRDEDNLENLDEENEEEVKNDNNNKADSSNNKGSHKSSKSHTKEKVVEKVKEKDKSDNKKDKNKERYDSRNQNNDFYYREKPVVVKQGVNPLMAFILFVLIMIFIGGCGLLLYIKYRQDNNKTNNNNKEATENVNTNSSNSNGTTNNVSDEQLDLSNTVVQTLYSYVKTTGLEDKLLNNALASSGSASSLKNSVKNYLGYRLLYESDIDTGKCSDYSKLLSDTSEYTCGSNDDDKSDETKILKSKLLKEKVELIFGPGSYKEEDFNDKTYSMYKYDKSTDKYVLISKKASNTDSDSIAKTLTKAMKTNNGIELYEFQENNTTGLNRNVKYTFINKADAYYLSKIEVQK